jgi:1,2-diacylglycerol 3-alpha-glucosyltransferase
VREVLLRFGVPEPVVVIPNGVDLDRFYHPSNPKSKAALGLAPSDVLAIYTGRLADEKNLTTLLAQFAVALDIVPQLKLLLVGDGPARGELLAQARELDISDAVHFYGSETYSSMPDILAAADIYITASVTEVHPLALIEAMAVGLPVVASRSPGIIETVEHGVSGLLAGQPQSGLAAAITPLASNGDLRRKMARAAREASRAYAISVTVQSTVELYERLCLERPDLLREQRHGRWFRPYERLKPQIKRFASKIGFDEGAYTLSGQDVDE